MRRPVTRAMVSKRAPMVPARAEPTNWNLSALVSVMLALCAQTATTSLPGFPFSGH